MAWPRINVKNSEAWGKLVKTWATGKNYVDHRGNEEYPVPLAPDIPPKYPKPSSFADFVKQCQQADVGLYFEGQSEKDETDVTGSEPLGFVLVQSTPDNYVLRLPAKVMIENSEQKIIAGDDYELPNFYRRIFGTDVKPGEVETAMQRIRLHAERVGEYTINTCH